MCKQYIGIAQCAPEDPGKGPLTFVCGGLHQYAAHRDTCQDAKGDCVCFFGTCGTIENVIRSQPFDLMSLPKMRCLLCTTREEQVGERRRGRDFLETKLLTRRPISDDGMPEHAKMLKTCWGGQNMCPFHDLEPSEASKPPSVNDAAGAGAEQVLESPNTAASGTAEPAKPTADEHHDDKAQEQVPEADNQAPNTTNTAPAEKETATIDESSIKPPEHANINSPENTDNDPFQQANDEPAFDRKAFENPDKINDEATKIKPMLGIETSRWAPGGASRPDTTPRQVTNSESDKPSEEATQVVSVPRRHLFNTPPVAKGTTQFAGLAATWRAHLGIA